MLAFSISCLVRDVTLVNNVFSNYYYDTYGILSLNLKFT